MRALYVIVIACVGAARAASAARGWPGDEWRDDWHGPCVLYWQAHNGTALMELAIFLTIATAVFAVYFKVRPLLRAAGIVR